MTEKLSILPNTVPINEEQPHRKAGHTCAICQKWFRKSGDLRRHGSVHIKEKSIQCDHCNLSFVSKERLYQHRKYFNLEKSHHCEFCSKSFKFKASLQTHLVVHTGKKPFECKMCDKSFRFKSGLDHHYKSQTYLAHHRQFEEFKKFEYLVEKCKSVDNYEHSCVWCNKTFKKASGLSLHTSTHSHETPYKCEFCELKFKRKGYQLRHQKNMHSSWHKVMYPCDICKKVFSAKRTLSKHIAKIHENYRPFKCEICPQALFNRSEYKKHVLTHSGDKKFACSMCDKKYASVHGLRYHLREHTGEKPYVCQVCNNSFKGLEILKNHSKKCKEIETTSEVKENVDSKIELVHSKNENVDKESGFTKPEKKNKGSNLDVVPPEENLSQMVSENLSAAKEAFSRGEKVFISKNVKFVKVQNTAELNLLRITHMFQRYRSLSSAYSKKL